MTDRVDTFLAMLERGQDSALLRFSIGNEYLQSGQPAAAIEHLQQAVQQQQDYSAAWKLLGRALAEAGRPEQAIDVYQRGMEVAQAAGDRQAAKEMSVFMRRLERERSS